MEASRALAAEVARKHGGLEERIADAFLRLTGREADEQEMNLLVDAYHEQRELFSNATEQDAAAFVDLGDAPTEQTVDPIDLAALAVTCQTILNLDATIYER